MAVPVNIDDLINHRTVESTRIEYKAGFNPEAIVHTICAFANDIDNMGGGYIIIGVEEQNGEPVFPVCGVPKNRRDHEKDAGILPVHRAAVRTGGAANGI